MDRLGKKKRVPKAATHVHRQQLPPSDLVQNKVCTDEEEKSKLKRKRAHSPEAEDIDDITPWGCKTYLSLSLYDDQNPVCNDIEEKSKLKRKRAHSPEAEDIDDTTPWGCKTGLSLYDDPWKIKKVLTGTDVQGHHNRLLLPYDLVESLVCPVLTDEEKSKLDSGEGTEIKFCDVNDNMSVHSLLLKKWPSSGSYVLIRNWTGNFVKRRELKKGDEIGLQWDKFNHRFNFSVLRSFSRSFVPVKSSVLDSANMDRFLVIFPRRTCSFQSLFVLCLSFGDNEEFFW
ncbi:hypothetical protein K1719_003577 [Acacia pycnantha]|nr:hypothetical protein K1719_003577 [Acacia pycnantha]